MDILRSFPVVFNKVQSTVLTLRNHRGVMVKNTRAQRAFSLPVGGYRHRHVHFKKM